MTTKPPSLIDLADDLAARKARAYRERHGGPEYEAALAPEVIAASGRVIQRRAMAADGVTLPALQTALAIFADGPNYKADAEAARLRREAEGTLQQMIELLTEARCVQDEARIQRKAKWEPTSWSLPEWIRVSIKELVDHVPGPPTVREVLDVTVPWWEKEIRRRLTPAEIQPEAVAMLRPERESLHAGDQTHAVSSTRIDEC